MAVSLEPNPTRFQKTLAMNDWYLGSDDWEFPLGGMQMLGKSDNEEIRAQAPRWAGKLSPDSPFEVLAHHAVDFWLCGRICRRPRTGSRWTGTARSTSASTRRTTSRASSGCATSSTGCSTSWGCASTICWIAASTCTRACRSARRPTRRAPSASGPTRERARRNCKAHDVDNLYVVDTSFFPSIGAVNPSLTAIANALRVGDHLTERLGW